MPVRWSTAHYRFSRAPCTATLYRRPSLARSFTSPRLSSSRPDLSRVLSPELPSPSRRPSSLHALSLSIFLSLRLPRSFPFARFALLARPLPPEYYVLTEIAVLSFPLCLSRAIPLPARASSLCLSSLLSPSFHPQCFPPTIAFSPSDSVSLHLSTIFILSLPFHLSSPSFSRYDSSAPPIERSTNSTTYRQIKFVLARRARHV